LRKRHVLLYRALHYRKREEKIQGRDAAVVEIS
jgi:hypothetical protein